LAEEIVYSNLEKAVLMPLASIGIAA